nr:hypothetical protein [Tanacetum cinerariifolium]
MFISGGLIIDLVNGISLLMAIEATDVRIVDPYTLQLSDILEMIIDNNCCQKQKLLENKTENACSNTVMLEEQKHLRRRKRTLINESQKTDGCQSDCPECETIANRRASPVGVVTLAITSGINLPFLIWGEMAKKFDIFEFAKMKNPVIIAISSAWASKKYGALQLNAMSATHYNLNPNILEAHHILNVFADFINPILAMEIQRKPYGSDIEEQMRNRYTIEALFSVNQYCFKAIVDDGTATATITCFSPAHTFVPDCNTIVNTIEDKDTYHVPLLLKQAEGHTYIFKYHFGKKAKPENPNFTLDAVFKPVTKPLLALPSTEVLVNGSKKDNRLEMRQRLQT